MQKKEATSFSGFELGFFSHVLELLIKHCTKEIHQQIFGVTDLITLKYYEHSAY